MALRRLAIAKSMGVEADFPIKFSKISVKDSSASKTAHSLGLSKVDPTMGNLTLPKTRSISEVVVHRADEGHWSMMFTAMKSPDKDKPESPAQKLIKIDLVQESYRIIYNATPETNPALHSTVYAFEGTQPTAEDIYRIVVDVGKQKGRWTQGYNCQNFVNEVLERLAMLPSATHWER
jgi:hypothetical protein